MGEINNGSENIIPLLSEGFLARWMPILTQVENQLKEFEESQQLLLNEMKITSDRAERQDNYEYISATFSKIPEYQTKLQYIRTTMLTMLSRSKILKRRVAQLKSIKDQQLAQVANIQQRERKIDQTLLAAKVVAAPEMQTLVLRSSHKKKKEKGKEKSKTKEKTKKKSDATSSTTSSKVAVTETVGSINENVTKDGEIP